MGFNQNLTYVNVIEHKSKGVAELRYWRDFVIYDSLLQLKFIQALRFL